MLENEIQEAVGISRTILLQVDFFAKFYLQPCYSECFKLIKGLNFLCYAIIKNHS